MFQLGISLVRRTWKQKFEEFKSCCKRNFSVNFGYIVRMDLYGAICDAFDNQKYNDCKLIAEKGEAHAHKLVLVSRLLKPLELVPPLLVLMASLVLVVSDTAGKRYDCCCCCWCSSSRGHQFVPVVIKAVYQTI